MEEQFVRCLMVETGEEKTVLQLLRVQRLGRGIYPQRMRVRKIRQVWRKDRIRLLPGYVFVFAEEEIPVWRYQQLEHVLKVLRYEKEPDGYLRGKDLEFACTVRELDGKLDILSAVDEEGFIRITDHLVNTLQGEVLSVKKQRREVKLRVNLMGQKKILTMNYQLVDDDGKPLSPADEMLDDESDEWLTAWTPDFSDELLAQMDWELQAPASASGESEAPESIPPAGYYHEKPESVRPADEHGKEPDALQTEPPEELSESAEDLKN